MTEPNVLLELESQKQKLERLMRNMNEGNTWEEKSNEIVDNLPEINIATSRCKTIQVTSLAAAVLCVVTCAIHLLRARKRRILGIIFPGVIGTVYVLILIYLGKCTKDYVYEVCIAEGSVNGRILVGTMGIVYKMVNHLLELNEEEKTEKDAFARVEQLTNIKANAVRASDI